MNNLINVFTAAEILKWELSRSWKIYKMSHSRVHFEQDLGNQARELNYTMEGNEFAKYLVQNRTYAKNNEVIKMLDVLTKAVYRHEKGFQYSIREVGYSFIFEIEDPEKKYLEVHRVPKKTLKKFLIRTITE